MRQKIDFKNVASHILFGKSTIKSIIDKFELDYRKRHKSIEWAVKMAFKQGRSKTEYEIDWLALYLEKDVFKKYQRKAS